jgi:hypothetical protein
LLLRREVLDALAKPTEPLGRLLARFLVSSSMMLGARNAAKLVGQVSQPSTRAISGIEQLATFPIRGIGTEYPTLPAPNNAWPPKTFCRCCTGHLAVYWCEVHRDTAQSLAPCFAALLIFSPDSSIRTMLFSRNFLWLEFTDAPYKIAATLIVHYGVTIK